MNFDEIPIRTLRAPFQISNERLHLEKFTLVASDMTCKLTGSVGFDGSLNVFLDVQVRARHLNILGINVGSALTALFGKEDRKIPLRVVFQGTFDAPEMSLEIQPEGQGQLDKNTEEVEDKLYKAGESLLEEWWYDN